MKDVIDQDLQAIEEGILFVNALTRAGLALRDGFQLGDVTEALGIIRTAPAFLRDYSLMLPEFKALTPESRIRLTNFVNANITLQDATIEGYLEKALTLLIAISDVFKLFAGKTAPVEKAEPSAPAAPDPEVVLPKPDEFENPLIPTGIDGSVPR